MARSGQGATRGLLAAGADHVTEVDRDPLALQMAAAWAGDYGDRLSLVAGNFSQLDEYAQDLDGIVLDLGVSSMQLDRSRRGFSFQKDGPLDMRMSQDGLSAADLVNEADEAVLADILYHYGEERASRRIARAITGRARSNRSPAPCNWPKSSRVACRARNRGKAIPRRAAFRPSASR